MRNPPLLLAPAFCLFVVSGPSSSTSSLGVHFAEVSFAGGTSSSIRQLTATGHFALGRCSLTVHRRRPALLSVSSSSYLALLLPVAGGSGCLLLLLKVRLCVNVRLTGLVNVHV